MKTPMQKLIDWIEESRKTELAVLSEADKFHPNDVRQARIINESCKTIISKAKELQKEELRFALTIIPNDDVIKNMMASEHFHYLDGRYRKSNLKKVQGGKMVRDMIKNKINLIYSNGNYQENN